MDNSNSISCPCGSLNNYSDCCGKYINSQKAPSAEALMRSRYTAYTLKNEIYLLNSWHPSTRPKNLNLYNDKTCWKGLKIISATKNQVSFVAYFINEDDPSEKTLFALYEESAFIKEQNWLYSHGVNLNRVVLTKNQFCPCKSGKKFKRCCEKLFTA